MPSRVAILGHALPNWKNAQFFGLLLNLVHVSRDEVRDDLEGYSEPKTAF
jgi:hypothetical protein